MNMQSTRPRENDCGARIDSDGLVSLAIEIRQIPSKGFENILDPPRVVLPRICGRVFQIEHDPRSA